MQTNPCRLPGGGGNDFLVSLPWSQDLLATHDPGTHPWTFPFPGCRHTYLLDSITILNMVFLFFFPFPGHSGERRSAHHPVLILQPLWKTAILFPKTHLLAPSFAPPPTLPYAPPPPPLMITTRQVRKSRQNFHSQRPAEFFSRRLSKHQIDELVGYAFPSAQIPAPRGMTPPPIHC